MARTFTTDLYIKMWPTATLFQIGGDYLEKRMLTEEDSIEFYSNQQFLLSFNLGHQMYRHPLVCTESELTFRWLSKLEGMDSSVAYSILHWGDEDCLWNPAKTISDGENVIFFYQKDKRDKEYYIHLLFVSVVGKRVDKITQTHWMVTGKQGYMYGKLFDHDGKDKVIRNITNEFESRYNDVPDCLTISGLENEVQEQVVLGFACSTGTVWGHGENTIVTDQFTICGKRFCLFTVNGETVLVSVSGNFDWVVALDHLIEKSGIIMYK